MRRPEASITRTDRGRGGRCRAHGAAAAGERAAAAALPAAVLQPERPLPVPVFPLLRGRQIVRVVLLDEICQRVEAAVAERVVGERRGREVAGLARHAQRVAELGVGIALASAGGVARVDALHRVRPALLSRDAVQRRALRLGRGVARRGVVLAAGRAVDFGDDRAVLDDDVADAPADAIVHHLLRLAQRRGAEADALGGGDGPRPAARAEVAAVRQGRGGGCPRKQPERRHIGEAEKERAGAA